MVAAPWRELCRFDDPGLARAVATSIASMEFEVHLSEPEGGQHRAFVIEVEHGDWPELTDVLDEIIDEQQEFDRMRAHRRDASPRLLLVTVVGLTGTAELLLLLALLDR